LKSIVNGASKSEAAPTGEVALVKLSDIREGEAALQDAGEEVKSGASA
jgi:hypothetical protein